MASTRHTARDEVVLHGIGVSSGVVKAQVFVLQTEDLEFAEKKLEAGDVEAELERFQAAIAVTGEQLREIQQQIDNALGSQSASIIEAHLLVLEDQSFIGEVIQEIKTRHRNAEAVLWDVSRRYVGVLQAIQDKYIRERVADIEDVTGRLMKNLIGSQVQSVLDIKEPCVVVARDLSPSDTASLDRSIVQGFATNLGSETSHTAILARALEIPAVVGLHDITKHVETGDQLLIDGVRGLVVINPSVERLQDYTRKEKEHDLIRRRLDKISDLPSETVDGYRVTLSANIEKPEEAEQVINCGAQGVGLYRSEYLFMDREELPSEDEQAEAYSRVASELYPESVVIRTLDIGGDKMMGGKNDIPSESNPSLGWRAIRYCLSNQNIFKTQLRAILRASVNDNIRVMYPMITCLSELLKANELLEECKKELQEEGFSYNHKIEKGAMIEVPSAALTVNLMAPHVNFFSLGTNDLIQYTMAVDRVNENVAHLYKPTHLAILNLIKHVVDISHEHGVWVSLCGEMGGDPVLAPLLIGMGVDELSVSPSRLPMVKYVLRKMRYSQIVGLAELSVRCNSPEEVLLQCKGLLADVDKEVLEILY
ncbi:phosphoenolpyruvate--protein phosphotransferase [Verrucomicrobiota bacterium]